MRHADERKRPEYGRKRVKRYAGSHAIDGIKVTCGDAPLDERYDLKRYTNAYLEWGAGREKVSWAAAALTVTMIPGMWIFPEAKRRKDK